jgi:cytochrome c-type biogenesis protein CcsB
MNVFISTIAIAFSLLSSPLLFSQEKYFCDKKLESFPIQQNGREKPLYVHAKETIKYLTGKTKVGNYSATEAYCLMSLVAFGFALPQDLVLKTKIEHPDLQSFLELKSPFEITFPELLLRKDDLRFESVKQKDENSYKKAINRLFNQLGLYSSVTQGTDWMAPFIQNQQIEWIPITSFLSQEKIQSLQGGALGISEYFAQVEKDFEKIGGKKTAFEYSFAKFNLPLWSFIITLIALFVLSLDKNRKNLNLASKIVVGLSFFLQLIYIICRIYISGRAPITNMYETVLFSGFASLILAMIIGHFKKDKSFLVVGLAYNALTLLMMNFSGGLLSSSISPLVPVLRDNFWLSTHVITIILSYGALALSWVLANILLLKMRFSVVSSQEVKQQCDYLYLILKFGTTLLAAGILLGGVWADYSWGRFWGWDPKETWSLIVFCLYMAILHGRYTNWIPNHRFIPLVAAAFLSVMMAWFGVNYILASGLHSYGFSEGGAVFLGLFTLVQLVLLAITWHRRVNQKLNT